MKEFITLEIHTHSKFQEAPMSLTGFTLIEALIAVTIVTFSIAGPLFTANRAIVSAQGARLQLTASHLAQEGIEQIRAVRDNQYLDAYHTGGANVSSAAWSSFETLIAECRTACSVDPKLSVGIGSGFSVQACSSGTCAPLYLSTSSGVTRYTQQSSGATATLFTRTIKAESAGNDENIRSTVSWDFHGTRYSVVIIDHLTSWQ